MNNNNKYWEDRSNKRMAKYHRNSNETINKINKAYDKAIEDINEDIKKIFNKYVLDSGLDPGEARKILNTKITKKAMDEIRGKIKYIKDDEVKKLLWAELNAGAYKARITRLEALKESIHLNTKLIADVELEATTSLYMNNIKEAYYRNIYDIQNGINLGFDVANMPNSRVEEILKQNWSGKHYSERIWNNTSVLAERLEETLLAGFMSGKSVSRMITDLEDLCNSGKYAAERLVRTETTYMCNQAEIESYKECDIEKYVFIATLDLRTSDTCREHDGKIYDVDKAMAGDNLPPLHPYCRSTTIAYMGEEWYKNLKRRARDPKTGKTYVINNMPYNEWYQKHVVDKYGKDKAEVMEKMIKNKASDMKQFEEFKKVLGKESPKSLKEFQELKYNNSTKWNELKCNYRDTNRYNKIIDNASILNIKGIPIKNIERIDLKEYEFDYHHINNEREHGVTKEIAQEFINNSKAAYSRWNGQVIVYVSENGCSVVNLKDKKVSTAYKSEEYDDKFKKLMEMLKND